MASSPPPPDSLLLHPISKLRFLLVFLCLLSISSSPAAAAAADAPAAFVSGSPDDSDSPAPANHVRIITVVTVVILAELTTFAFWGMLLLACGHYVKEDHQKRGRNAAIWVTAGVHVLLLFGVITWVIK